MNTETNINTAQSLEIIQRMIDSTRTKFDKGGGASLLTWGYTSLSVGILVIALYFIFKEGWVHMFWWLIPIVGMTIKLSTANKTRKPVKTYIDKFVGNIWLVTGIICALYPLMMFFPIDQSIRNFFLMSIIPFEGIILSMAVCITGATIEFRPMIVGGALSIIISLLMFVFPGHMVYLFLLMFIVAMIIPGHILNYKGKCSKN